MLCQCLHAHKITEIGQLSAAMNKSALALEDFRVLRPKTFPQITRRPIIHYGIDNDRWEAYTWQLESRKDEL